MLLPSRTGYYNTQFIVDIVDGHQYSGYIDFKHFVPNDINMPSIDVPQQQAKLVRLSTGNQHLILEYEKDFWEPLIEFLRTESGNYA